MVACYLSDKSLIDSVLRKVWNYLQKGANDYESRADEGIQNK